MGCLSAPFKLLGVLALFIVLAIGWLYRDRLGSELGRVLTFSAGSDAPTGAGRPGTRAMSSARAKIDSLNGWRADSVVLTPAEFASLIGSGLTPSLRRQLDSLQVELRDGEVAVNAKLATARLPRELTGPLAIALREREPIEATGPIDVTGPGKAEWSVRSFRIREFPIPRDAVPKLVARAFGDTARRTIPVGIPEGIREIRIRPSGATLFGARP
jgi:hypothetical protein